jgi:two-component system nitrogen regulation response regulator GlnG
LGRDVTGVSEEALAVLRSHIWPGNVRELESVVTFAAVHAVGDVITPADLPDSVRGAPAVSQAPESARVDHFPDVRAFVRRLARDRDTGLNEAVHTAIDRILLEEVLEHVGGHQARAAELLGISRTTLRARLHQLGVSVEKVVKDETIEPRGEGDE